MKNTVGRPPKKPDAKKQKVTLSLNPAIYGGAKDLCFEEGISISEKFDRSLAPQVKFAKELKKISTQTGLKQSDLVEAATIHLVRVFSARFGKTILPLDLDEIISGMQQTRGEY